MSETIVVLTEQPLLEADAANLTALHPDRDVDFHVVLPSRTGRSLLVELIDRLSLFELPDRARDEGGAPHRPRPDDALQRSLDVLGRTGATATGEVATEKPVDALVAAVRAHDAREAVVITAPHAVEDTFHTDWATKAQDTLGLPVLHLYSGSSFIGDS
ncbi:hypothetical protein GCM10011512_28790 [Tersicoccus solisilvae]|uniref:UspA domain-containing protein n=1 Tax=Tersicoccus solisilvae TaxID=1882339 RepID=A0ABQ1PNM3_9MICC|nr:hypothetical protein [Tersicoccus solisilvae]GGD00185.1 hypothetical protein GCM10011512_28790 [Tersicoccus solisilvae]